MQGALYMWVQKLTKSINKHDRKKFWRVFKVQVFQLIIEKL